MRVLQPEKAAELAPELAPECAPADVNFWFTAGQFFACSFMRVKSHCWLKAFMRVWEAPISLASLWLE